MTVKRLVSGCLVLSHLALGRAAAAAGASPPPARVKGVLEQDQEFAAQEWPAAPGPRGVRMWVQEPPSGIGANTGLMLVLHNWGGVYNNPTYLAWCRAFSARYNVIAISVNYLQSGKEWIEHKDRPYDHGYLQAMDCLGALYTVRQQLAADAVAYNERRTYVMGGSGGGNVAQMVAKLAPHTFACAVDICGMPGLTDGIAYGTGEYGSGLNARYSRDPASPAYLTQDMQEIRDFGNLVHCRLLQRENPELKIVIVHGIHDRSCPVVHKVRQFQHMLMAGLDVDGRFLTEVDVDGDAVTTTGHAVGNRERVVVRFADVYLQENGKHARATSGPSDFARGGEFAYPTTNGEVVVTFSGYPSVRFNASAADHPD